MVRIEKLKRLAAGNVWSCNPVVVATLSGGRDFAPTEIRRLRDAIGGQRDDTVDFPAWSAVAAATAPVPAETALAVLAVLLQRTIYWPATYCERGRPGVAVFETRNLSVGRTAARRAADVVAALEAGATDRALAEAFDLAVASFQKREARRTPGFDAFALARSAGARGIAWTSIPESNLLRLGWGRHAKVIRGSESSDTSLMGKNLAKKKPVTTSLLSQAGVPVPVQRTVRSVKSALRAHLELGRDVVVKPAEGKQGKGVTLRPGSALQLARAYARAAEISRPVLVEAFVPGEEFRLLVIDGAFRAASKRRPAHVAGDGVSTIRQLIEAANADPMRRPVPLGRLAVRLPLRIDATTAPHLARQGYTLDSVPARDAHVALTAVSNVSTGGDTVDVTAKVHPEVGRMAERAARVLGIDLCGIDYLTRDIARPPADSGGRVLEANTMPGLSLHLAVSEGEPQDVASDYIASLFPEGACTRVPVVALMNDGATTGLVDRIAAAARRRGATLGVYRVDEPGAADLPGDAVRLPGVDAITWEQNIDCALVEVSRRALLRSGLGVDRVDLAILPPERGGARQSRMWRMFDKISQGGVIAASDPEALDRALRILTRADRTPAPAGAARPTALRGKIAPTGPTFTASFVGDIGFGESYRHYPKCRDLQRLLDVEGYEYCLSGLRRFLDRSDMVIGNLEVPLSPRPDERLRGRKKFLGWCDPRRTAKALVSAGFSALSLANNHARDCGALGQAATQEQLARAGIASFGAGANRALAERPVVRKVSLGRRTRTIVVFAGFEYRARYDRKFHWYAGETMDGVARLDPARIGAQIRALGDELEDPIFVAFPHWGLDYHDVTDGQRALAAALIDAGVDVVIGHGTHSSQRVEAIEGRPVVFGLGNFVWNAPQSGFAKHDAPPFGLVAELTLAEGGEFGLSVHPIVTDRAVTGFRNRPVTDVEFEAAIEAIVTDTGWAPLRDSGGRCRIDFAGARGTLAIPRAAMARDAT